MAVGPGPGTGAGGPGPSDRGPPYVRAVTMWAGDGVDHKGSGRPVRRLLGIKARAHAPRLALSRVRARTRSHARAHTLAQPHSRARG